MLPEENRTWVEDNQRVLASSIARIREYLAKYARHAGLSCAPSDVRPVPDRPEVPGEPVVPELSPPAALAMLCGAFRLSPFERDLLLLCAGVELDSAVASLVTALAGNGGRPNPTFSLALAALPRAHWSALTPFAPLRRFRLIERMPELPLTASPLKIDERILHYLAGISYPDERLAGLTERFSPQGAPAPSHDALVRRIVRFCTQAKGLPRLPVIALAGRAAEAKKDIAARVCRELGLYLYVLSAQSLPAAPADCDALIRLWDREAMLLPGALLVDFSESEPADKLQDRAATRFLETAGGMVFVAAPEGKPLERRRQAIFDVLPPSAAEQRFLWLSALGQTPAAGSEQLNHLTWQFQLSPRARRAACDEALACAADDPAALWEACRRQARPRLEQLACRIDPQARWNDLVLPAAQKETLRIVAAQVRLRYRVYEAWGFAAKSGRGLGVSALFTGASGTGKTLAAEVLAGDLRLDLFRIDLSQVVNKYIGETEKNLKRVFDAAEAGGAILLFDEADALFGKRSDVKDSHDRYANIEVSYLLQRMESYRGLAILTTNMKDALDPAFLRRIRFIVSFPFPDAAQREEIWRGIFPARTPTAGLDPKHLSLLQITGGSIRNIALGAAFLAADAGRPVVMDDVRQAARREYAKLEKQMSAAEAAAFSA